ncbi:peptidase [Actinoplanes sp. NPDC049265]|uniref:peptidase n=1 Tax=Actinoplanes sp. NPDC049265 TaxID=3363902 RepID=UPI00371C24C0
MSPHRRWLAAAATAATVTALGTASPAAAAPSVPAGSATVSTGSAAVPAGSAVVTDAAALLAPADLRRMEQQRPLVAAASVVRWELERHAYPGYAGIVLEESSVALWWKGEVPASMRRVVAQASRTAKVQVRPADYSVTELRAAAGRLRAAWPGGDDAIEAIKFRPDGSGLVVSVPTSARPQAAPAVGVPVDISAEAALRPVSRDDDWAPWKGGATIVNPDQGTACTSGFGVRNGSASYILTAAHCGQSGQRFTDARGESIGTIGPRNQDHDVELVPTSSVDGYVYIGTPTDGAAALVQGWDWTFVGEYLCQSGVSSSRDLGRPVCNLKVLFFYSDREDLVEAEQTEGQPAARPGDSGGPIYSVASNGKIVAKGTTTRTAGARLGFQDYGTAWRDFGVVPATR